MNQRVVRRKLQKYKIVLEMNFFGGPVVGNLPAKTGDMISIPDPGRYHMLGSN